MPDLLKLEFQASLMDCSINYKIWGILAFTFQPFELLLFLWRGLMLSMLSTSMYETAAWRWLTTAWLSDLSGHCLLPISVDFRVHVANYQLCGFCTGVPHVWSAREVDNHWHQGPQPNRTYCVQYPYWLI